MWEVGKGLGWFFARKHQGRRIRIRRAKFKQAMYFKLKIRFEIS